VLAKQAPSAPLIGALSSSPLSRLASGARTLDRSITFAFQDVDSIARSRNLRRRKPTAASIRPSSQSYRGLVECRGAPAATQASSCDCPQPAIELNRRALPSCREWDCGRLGATAAAAATGLRRQQHHAAASRRLLGCCPSCLRGTYVVPLSISYIHIALMWGPSSAFPASTTVPAPAYI